MAKTCTVCLFSLTQFYMYINDPETNRNEKRIRMRWSRVGLGGWRSGEGSKCEEREEIADVRRMRKPE